MHTYKDAHYRSLIKALTWRVLATTTTILIVFVFTGRLVLSLGVGAVEVITKLILYYLHERVWGGTVFGKKKHPLSDLPVEKALSEKDMQTIKDKLKDLGYISEE